MKQYAAGVMLTALTMAALIKWPAATLTAMMYPMLPILFVWAILDEVIR